MKTKDLTFGSNCMPQTSDGGASSVAMVELESISKTLMKLSREAEAARNPAGWAATATTPRACPPEGVPTWFSSSELQNRTVSSSEPVRRSADRVSVAGAHAAVQMDSSWAFSTDFIPASFIDAAGDQARKTPKFRGEDEEETLWKALLVNLSLNPERNQYQPSISISNPING